MTEKVYTAPTLDSLSLRATSDGPMHPVPSSGSGSGAGGDVNIGIHIGIGLPGLGS